MSGSLTRRRPTPVAWLLIGPIRFYQRFITPYTPATCRYYPTCSSYAVTALRKHGALRGSWLTVRRLARCHPWSDGGIDHVPPPRPRGVVHDAVQPAGQPTRIDCRPKHRSSLA